MRRRHVWWIGAFVGLLALVTLGSPAAEPTGRPRLVVLVIFDQLRGDYLQRWNDLFTEDGFRRLEREGTWFTNCHYPYAATWTAAGHASLATGCSPDRHGIIANEWYDRAVGEEVYCVTAERYQTVYSVPLPPPDKDAKTTKTPKGGGTRTACSCRRSPTP